MTCLTGKLKDVPCILCQQADQVYIGHGKVRFCAHCSITWDPTEDDSPIDSKSIIFADDAVDGQLPEDIVGRMGVLSGMVLDVFDFETRLAEVLALPEALFNNVKFTQQYIRDSQGRFASRGGSRRTATKKKKKEGEGDKPASLATTTVKVKRKKKVKNPGTFETPKALQESVPDTGIAGGWRPPEERVWQGQRYAEPGSRLSLLQTGELGEQIAMRAFSDKYKTPFEGLNVNRNNAPIDVKGDHIGLEIKGAMGYNGDSSRAWRSMEGQRSKTEVAYLKTLSKDDKRAYTDKKRVDILVRKQRALQELTDQANGEVFTGKMAGLILSADGRHADVFEIDGFHRYVGWPKGATEANYVGTYSVGDDAFNAAMGKAVYMKGILENPVGLLYEWGYIQEEEVDWFEPEDIELLAHENIFYFLDGNGWYHISAFLDALTERDVDPLKVEKDELVTIWNHTFPQEPIEVDVTFLLEQKRQAMKELEIELKEERNGDSDV